jgi:hypothetical protein
MDFLAQKFSYINWTAPTWDLFIILAAAIAILVYGFTLGKEKVVAIMVSIYIALAITTYIPVVHLLYKFGCYIPYPFMAQLLTFWILFILLSIFFNRGLVGDIVNREGKWWHLLIFNLLHIGLLMSITLSLAPRESVMRLHSITREIFIGDMSSVIWIISPVVFLSIFKV